MSYFFKKTCCRLLFFCLFLGVLSLCSNSPLQSLSLQKIRANVLAGLILSTSTTSGIENIDEVGGLNSLQPPIISTSDSTSPLGGSEMLNLRIEKKPNTSMYDGFKNKFSIEKMKKMPAVSITENDLGESEEIVVTLKAYLDEAERYLFSKDWDKLNVFLNTFAQQENAFANLMDGLFPANDDLDRTAREELGFEAQWMFLAIDDLTEASKDHQFKNARASYAQLLLAYDRFLKAGNLYPSYDVITSTEVLFNDIPRESLRFDTTSKLRCLDKVILTSGPDMGKTGTIIDIMAVGKHAIVKFDKDENNYQRTKDVKLSLLAKNIS